MSLRRRPSLWSSRILMPTAAVMGLSFPLMLEQWLGEPIAYGLAAVLFVLLPAIMEPDEPFGAAAVFYGIGTLLILAMYGGSGLLGLWKQGLIVLPPIITGLGCVLVIGHVRGYGNAARFFSLPAELTRAERIWLVLRRVLLIPLALAVVFIVTRGSFANEDRIYSLCPLGNFIENDSEPAYCINPSIERLVTLNGYAGLIAPLVLNIFGAALLEPRHKRLMSGLVWLVGSGFLALLTPLILLDSGRYLLAPVLAFGIGALCVWLVGHIYPAVPT